MTTEMMNVKVISRRPSGDGGAEPKSEAASLFAQVDGEVTACRLCGDAGERVILEALAEAKDKHRSLMPSHPDLPEVTAGAFLYVPAGVKTELPFHLSYENCRAEADAWHTIIVAGPGADFQVVETLSSTGRDKEHALTGEVVVGKGARVQIVSLQNWGSEAGAKAVRRTRLEEGAKVEWVVINLGSRNIDDQVAVHMVEKGATANIFTIYFAADNQKVKLETGVYHEAPHTTSDILAKGIAKDRSTIDHLCLTRITHEAYKAAAYQRSQALLLDGKAQVTARPYLEIKQQDVQAGHAVSTGQIDEEQLFYLASRGLSRRQAEQLIVEGFFSPVLQRVPLSGVRATINQTIIGKMNDAAC